jgi:ubiquinone/menaquinone biosynthesis C-methylase UbiE
VKLNWVERLVVNSPMRMAMQRMEIRRLRAMMTLEPGATVLELGCGRGVGAKLIAETFSPSIIHALDLDLAMVQKARAYLSSRPNDVRLYVADGIMLPFRDGSMDAVFSFGILHHIVDWRAAVAEVSRVLGKGGRLYLEELYPGAYQNIVTARILVHPSQDRFRGQDLRAAIAKCGMEMKAVKEFKPFGMLGVAVKTPSRLGR